MAQEALSHAPTPVHQQGDFGDVVDGIKGDNIKLRSDENDRPRRARFGTPRKTCATRSVCVCVCVCSVVISVANRQFDCGCWAEKKAPSLATGSRSC